MLGNLWKVFEVKLIMFRIDGSVFRSSSPWKAEIVHEKVFIHTSHCVFVQMNVLFNTRSWEKFRSENEVTKWNNWVVSLHKEKNNSKYITVDSEYHTHTHSRKIHSHLFSKQYVYIMLSISRINAWLKPFTASLTSRQFPYYPNGIVRNVIILWNWKLKSNVNNRYDFM